MKSNVLTFPNVKRPVQARRPVEYPIAPTGGEVIVCDTDHGEFHVYDISPSGGSAGGHGHFTSHDEAVAVAKRIAAQINGSFHDISREAP